MSKSLNTLFAEFAKLIKYSFSSIIDKVYGDLN